MNNNIINNPSNGIGRVSTQIINLIGTAANKIGNVATSASTAATAATAASRNINLTNQFKTPYVIYSVLGMVLILVIILFIVLLKVKIPFTKQSKSNEETVSNTFIVIFAVLLVVGVCITFLPNFIGVKNLFEQISNVTYVILYTIFLILFFTMMPRSIINEYAYIISPITALLGMFMFYKGYSNNYATAFNVNYERIKLMILFFCLITIFIVYYNIDPGGYIRKYFGYSMLLTIIITVFAFLYLMIVLTLSDTTGTADAKGATTNNLLNSFSGISSYGSLGFLLFIIITTITISTYPGGFFNNTSTSVFGMILILIISILWSVVLGFNLFPEIGNNK